ncbi:potassium transporter TrkG [Candidatus Nitrososphaera gargensis]|uniref:potassium transporter TrkG n=1 Tax=Candidatus Nitrososphaera gargensis TaxID=497727 RepID=UPI0011E54576|nr:potassium transporter TrkG [Candidatus Nitrososphaera gargensis]
MQDPLERPVASYATNRFLLIDGRTNVAVAVRQMQVNKMEAIVVTHGGSPVGIVTDSDILEKVVIKGEDSDEVLLKDVMTSPIITLPKGSTGKEALESMKSNKIKRILITDRENGGNDRIIGMVTQKTLANAVRTSVIERTFRKYRASIRERYKPVLGNLGFVMQFAGILMVVPAFLGTAHEEFAPTTGMYLAVVGMFSTGFVLNAYGERGPLSLKEASILVISSFILLSFFGSFPYMYLNPFWPEIDGLSLFVNSFFESISGFTTTGMTMITQPENLPQSFVFFRSYTQWIGGLSFIYLIMAIFYPEKKLKAIRGVLGGDALEYRQLIVTIVLIFSAYTAVLFLILLFLNVSNPVYDISLVFSAIVGGGFTPDSTIVSVGNIVHLLVASVAMIISALPFAFHYSIFYKSMRIRKIGIEVLAYIVLLVTSAAILAAIAGIEWLPAAFHSVSASTNTGFQFVDIQVLPTEAKIVMIVLMLIGGTAFSTAGGIKIGRFLLLFQKLVKRTDMIETPSSISRLAVVPDQAIDFKAKKESDKLLRETLLVIALFPAVAVLSGLALGYLNNANTLDAVFSSTSSLTNTGLQVGLVSMDSDLITKSILAANMIAGRFEIIAILYIFFASLRRV